MPGGAASLCNVEGRGARRSRSRAAARGGEEDVELGYKDACARGAGASFGPEKKGLIYLRSI